jgi:hypothetical protein
MYVHVGSNFRPVHIGDFGDETERNHNDDVLLSRGTKITVERRREIGK